MMSAVLAEFADVDLKTLKRRGAQKLMWEEMKQVAGPGFRDMSRLAAGNSELYADIVSTNREEVLRSLAAVESSLAKLRRHLEAGDGRLVELLEEAKLARDLWEGKATRAGHH